MSKPVTKLEIYVGLVVICVALGGTTSGTAWWLSYSIHKTNNQLRIDLTQNIHGLQNEFNQGIHELRCDFRKI